MITGLPDLPASVSVFTSITLLTADTAQLLGSIDPLWGIFLDGAPVVLADNVMSVHFKASARLSKYPQEQGAFATFNKVIEPFRPRVSFSTGGALVRRQALLDSIGAIAGDTNLYDVTTPEKTYTSCNVLGFEYKRSDGAAGLITVEVELEEVRLVGASAFGNTASPTDAAQVNNGLVQSQGTVTLKPGPTSAGFQ